MMDSSGKKQPPILPVEVELYVNPDGSVTFADLSAELIPLVETLNPDHPSPRQAAQPKDTSEKEASG